MRRLLLASLLVASRRRAVRAGRGHPERRVGRVDVRRHHAAALAAQRQLHDRRAPRSRDPHDHRLRNASPGATSRAEPAADLQFHLYWNAWKNTRSTFMRERALGGGERRSPAPAGRLGAHRRHVDRADRRRRGPARASKRFIAPDDGNASDETVMAVPLPQPIAPGASVTIEIAVDGARAAHVRPHRRDRQLLLHRAVVPQARRAAGRRLELPPVPLRHRVLLRLRRLRRLADGAGRLAARRDRRASASAATTPTARPTHRYYQEDVHDFAWTTSPDYVERTARFEHPTLPPVEMRLLLQPEHAGAGRAPLRRDAHDAAVLRRVVRRVSVRPHHDRRSGVPERRRRHGVPDALHRRHALARAGRRHDAGGRHGPRSRPPVLVRHRRQQRVRGRVDGRGVQHVLDGARRGAGLRSRTISRCATSAASCRGCSRDIALGRETDGNRLAGYRRDAKSDAQSTPTLPLLPGDRRQHHLQQDRAVAEHARALARLADAAARSCPRYFARWKFRHPKPAGFLRDRQRGDRAAISTWFFDQVYRSSNVFDYGVQDLTSARDGDRFRTTVVVRRYGEATSSRWTCS